MTANINIDKLNFAATKVLVLGDVMLDQYWHGATDRISPEAPVPVVRIQESDTRLGGAANVAWNLQALGCQVQILSVIGADQYGQELINLLDQKSIMHNLVVAHEFSTIRKLRVLSRRQQMLRLDHEDYNIQLSAGVFQDLLSLFKQALINCDAVILSDYAKGVLRDPQPFIQAANAHNVPVYVDPKTDNFTVYAGAQLLKPNQKEFEAAVGKCNDLNDLEVKGRELLQKCNISTLVVTRGSEGVSLITQTNPAIHLPACGGEVFDVTGAGDTVMASLVAAKCCGVELSDAVQFSSYAAGVVVGKVGTSTANVAEIKSMIHKRIDLPTGIMAENVLRDVIKISQARGEKVVFVNGCYDMIHYGHTRYFAQAKALGDRLVVGVNSDASVKKLKGEDRPFYSLDHRMEVLASLKAIDWVVAFEETTPGRLVESLNPNVLVKGGENYKSVSEIPATEGTAHVLRNGGEVHIVARTPDCSSTQMLENIR